MQEDLNEKIIYNKGRKFITIQLRVFDNLLERAWMQYATSARGRETDVAKKISTQKNERN